MDELAHNTREPSTLPRSMEHLTPREAEIVGLIGRGCTNREIAEDLVITSLITEGTAALHVKHALSKLGFRARAQLAAWSSQQAQVSTR